jgi:hypothetical protein
MEFYKKDDGFCNVMNFFWVSIIFPFLCLNVDNSYFIYVVCRINLSYERYMVEEIEKVLILFGPYGPYADRNMFVQDPFNLFPL